MSSFGSLSVAMFKGFFRDKAALFFTFFFPLMFLIIFGLIFKDGGSGRVEIAVTGDGPVVAALSSMDAVELTRHDSFDDAVATVRAGDVSAAVTENGDQVVVRYAASDQVRAGTVQGLLSAVVGQANQAASGQPPRFTMVSEQVEDSSLKPIQYLTPGILSWGVASSAAFGVATGLVNWRRRQVLRRLRLAPVRPLTILNSRLSVTLGVAVVQAVLYVAIALTPPFGLKLSGQWWWGLLVLLVGTLAFFAIGMLAGAVSKSEEATVAIVNCIVLPMAFLSGTFFPIDNAPGWLRSISVLLPLRHMNDGLLNVMVRGMGLESILLNLGVLLGFTVVIGALAAWAFQWEDR